MTLDPDADAPGIGAPLFWPEERWRRLQTQQLSAHLQHAATSPLYRARNLPAVTALPPAELDALFHSLALTTKDDLAAAGPLAWAVPSEEVREWVCTSGTAGTPLSVPLTKHDLSRLAENEATALSIAGLGRGDVCLLSVAMDRMFVAGLAYWLGAQRLGAACVRIGPHAAAAPALPKGHSEPARAKVLAIAVPSFLLGARALHPALAGIVAIGEPIRSPDGAYNYLGRRLHEEFHCPVMSTYASTETCTTFAEGPLCHGGHLNPALALLEVLDDAGRQVNDGEIGEVVLTPLGVVGMPLLRFRTGDIATLHTAPCPCGRTTPRLGPILGRRQHLLKIRGVSLYPNAIIDAARTLPGVRDCALIAEEEHTLSDRITLIIEPDPATDPTLLRETLTHHLRHHLRVTPEIQLATPAELKALHFSTNSRKTQRFLDRRPTHPKPSYQNPPTSSHPE